MIRQPPEVEGDGFRETPHDAAVFFDQIALAVDQGGLRVAGQHLHGVGDGPRIIEVIGVQPGDDLPAAALETFVDGAALAAVGMTAEPDLLSVALEDFPGTVAAAAVENQHLQRRVILGQDAVDGGPQVLGLLVGRNDDADQRVHVLLAKKREKSGCKL